MAKLPTSIPHDQLLAAFVDGTEASRIAKQTELFKDYLDDPEPGKRPNSSALEAAAARWGTKIGSLKPGRDPDAIPEENAKVLAGTDNHGIEPSKNPYAANWRAPRAPKDDADREEQRQIAIVRLFKVFGPKKAAALAAAHGKQISGQPLRPVGAAAIAARRAGAR